jgi:ubiquinone/menaquinone biosynthesis C-methylase UbiE
MDTIFKQRELAEWGHAASVDVVGLADELPLPDGGEDYVLTSHVLEHVEDPIGALLEWDRVVRPGGVIFMIVPHKERTFDVNEDRTTLEHVISDIGRKTVDFGPHKHFWVMDDMLHIVQWMRENLSVQWRVLEAHDVDDKTGNGFTIVIRKESERLADEAAA